MPSTVISTTMLEAASASITGWICCTAVEHPVERIGTPTGCGGVGNTTWNGFALRRSSASSASCTLTGRESVSDRMATTSPARTQLSSKARAKQSIHFPSMRSVSMRPRKPRSLGHVFRAHQELIRERVRKNRSSEGLQPLIPAPADDAVQIPRNANDGVGLVDDQTGAGEQALDGVL